MIAMLILMAMMISMAMIILGNVDINGNDDSNDGKVGAYLIFVILLYANAILRPGNLKPKKEQIRKKNYLGTNQQTANINHGQ